MTARREPVTRCAGCPCALTKDGSRCGYKALRGDEWCLRTNPGGTIGLPMGEGWRSPFQYGENEERGKYW